MHVSVMFAGQPNTLSGTCTRCCSAVVLCVAAVDALGVCQFVPRVATWKALSVCNAPCCKAGWFVLILKHGLVCSS